MENAHDHSSLLFISPSAYAVSGDGAVITGEGLFNGEARGFVVTVPGPGSAVGLALGGLAAVGWKRRRR